MSIKNNSGKNPKRMQSVYKRNNTLDKNKSMRSSVVSSESFKVDGPGVENV